MLDLEQCKEAIDGEYTETYEMARNRLELLKTLVKKYRPQAIKDVFEYNGKNLTEWEETEHVENVTKRKLYIERANMALSEVVA